MRLQRDLIKHSVRLTYQGFLHNQNYLMQSLFMQERSSDDDWGYLLTQTLHVLDGHRQDQSTGQPLSLANA
jgi:hypothetical protein